MRAPVAALLLLLAACPGGGGNKTNNPTPPPDAAPAAPAESLTAEEAAVVDRLTDLTIDLATKMQAAGEDCVKLAGVVNSWADANGAEQEKLYPQMATFSEAKLKVGAARASAKTKEHLEVFQGMQDRV
ncbi:MAG TPA: hypothetical protein VL172_15595, partial [Kofleriaceae bacterium]|nr:hypothetical protein [Kofleriaceae bacterium]